MEKVMYIIDIMKMEFIFYHQRAVLAWILSRYGFCLVITSLYRQGDKGVHGQLPCRGTDLRCWSDSIGQQIASDVNDHWEYDPERTNTPYEKFVAIYHDTGKGKHLHIQTHQNTREM